MCLTLKGVPVRSADCVELKSKSGRVGHEFISAVKTVSTQTLFPRRYNLGGIFILGNVDN
jgi:hypothetical protein